jgi:F0F1-type ATP synthase assembly protein I
MLSIPTARYARYAGVAIEFTSPIIGGAILGHYLDVYFKTEPYLTLIALMLGVFAGFYRLVVVLRDLIQGESSKR